MAKDKSEKKDKKEKKALKAAALADSNGVTKVKKEKKEKRKSDVTKMLEEVLSDAEIENVPIRVKKVDADGDEEMSEDEGKDAKSAVEKKMSIVVGATVPFANPLADEKANKKVMKGVKKAAKHKTLKRGVKEVVKALRKSPPTTAAAPSNAAKDPIGIVIIAADISPMDVISHLPVLCEDHGIPYIYVASRAELGTAGATKRPTSVVMIARDRVGKKGAKEEGGAEEEEYKEVYSGLVKLVVKASESVKK